MVFVMKIVTILTLMAMIITNMIMEIAALRKSMNAIFTIMDTTAITLAHDNAMPIRIFNIGKKGEFARVLQNKGDFTTIK